MCVALIPDPRGTSAGDIVFVRGAGFGAGARFL